MGLKLLETHILLTQCQGYQVVLFSNKFHQSAFWYATETILYIIQLYVILFSLSCHFFSQYLIFLAFIGIFVEIKGKKNCLKEMNSKKWISRNIYLLNDPSRNHVIIENWVLLDLYLKSHLKKDNFIHLSMSILFFMSF